MVHYKSMKYLPTQNRTNFINNSLTRKGKPMRY
jgi:hypothetical protein